MREEGALGGLEICCGAWTVRHSPLGHPTITQSHPPSFSDGQGQRQAPQLPTLALQGLCYLWSRFLEKASTVTHLDTAVAQADVLMRAQLRASCRLGKDCVCRLCRFSVFVARYPMMGDKTHHAP